MKYDAISQMVFNSINGLWEYTLHLIDLDGEKLNSRDGSCKEIIGQQFILTNVNCNFLTNPIRKLSPTYAAAELLWYFSGTNKIEMIKHYATQYERFSDDGIITYGAYGYRWKLHDQLNKVIKILRELPNTRRAVITCYSAMLDLYEDKKDIPCTLSLQFLIRNNKLHCICTMRSNDIWLGLPYDIFSFTCLQILIAQELNIEVGTYTHQVGSLHLYKRNYEKVQQILDNPIDEKIICFNWKKDKRSLFEQIDQAVYEEKEIRSNKGSILDEQYVNTLLLQLVIWAGLKTNKALLVHIQNKEMKNYIRENIWESE